MSRFRGSPSRSPFRSPPRLYQTEREAIIEDEIRLKSAIKVQSDMRRMNDQLALLQIKVRHTNELEDKVESLIRQNNQLARDNDELARQLNERRYQLQRIRAAAADHHDREAIRVGQLIETNKSLQLQIQLLKKERIQGNRLFEAHIDKIQRMLDQKVLQLDGLTLKCNDLSKELELSQIRFQQQRNRLKNLMTRTEHELQRQLQYTKQKTTSEKFSEIDAMKRNHAAQILILQDQLSKLKNLNALKTEEFESQLLENRNLRKKHDEQIRLLGAENDQLRAKMFKLEQINRSQVQNIQAKYTNYHSQGTTNLKQQHGRQMTLLLDQIDKQKWLINAKNIEIQTLVQQKREQKNAYDQNQLQLSTEINNLKNKLSAQQQRSVEQNHILMARINQLINKSLTESESYHQRAIQFRNKINKLQGQINDKQNLLDKNKKQSEIKEKQLKSQIADLNFNLEQTKGQLSDQQYQRKQLQSQFETYKTKVQNQLKDVYGKLKQTQTKLQISLEKNLTQGEDQKNSLQILKVQIQALKNTISMLQAKLSQQQRRHVSQMQQFSNNLNQKLKKLQIAQKKALDELEQSKKQQINTLNLRIQKLNKDKNYAESELKRYIQMYSDLQKYFKNPHDGALFEQKSKNSIYKVLQSINKSSIHIF